MERLTEKVFAFNGTSCMQIKDCDNDTCDQTCRSRTGSEGCEGCPIQIAIDKLAEYEDLEEQGKLLKLPCVVGDMVYHLCAFSSGESEIIEMKVCCVEPCGAIRNHKGVCEVWNVYAEADYTKAYFKFFDFGKTVFLTRPDAERALAEMEGKK